MHFSVYYTYQKWFLLEIIFGKYAPRQFHNQIYTDTTEFFSTHAQPSWRMSVMISNDHCTHHFVF